MDFAFSPEQEALQQQAREFLAGNPAPSWGELVELGWTGVSVPEDAGGAGLGFLEEAILVGELARVLHHGPFLSTVVCAAPVLPPEQQAEVARGEARWTLALGPLVPDLDTAERVAVAGGDGVYELTGFEATLLETSDETRPLGVVTGGEAGERLASAEVLPEIRTRLLSALAAEACAVGARALEHAVEHASTRLQFGRPIGSYQAVSHPLATTYMELELARSLALWAAWCVATGDDRSAMAAAAAKSQAAEAGVAACERAIQVLAGTGFTWEHELHRLYKRALWIRAWAASGAELRAEVAARLLDEGA